MTTSQSGPPVDRDLQPHHRLMLRDSQAAARRLEQRQADLELVTRAALSEFRGEEWEEIVGELASYGWGVAFSWLLNGHMETKCKQAGRPCPRLHGHTRRPEWAESLASDLMIESIIRFRDEVLVPGKWDPMKGASLKTFFVGQMLKRFANVHREWRRRELVPALTTAELKVDGAYVSTATTETAALDRASMAAELKGLDELALRVVELRAADRPREEIARTLGVTLPTIDSILYKLRKAHVA
jgi:DNA-directed RNA polymerase specialized sigma24 family protein